MDKVIVGAAEGATLAVVTIAVGVLPPVALGVAILVGAGALRRLLGSSR